MSDVSVIIATDMQGGFGLRGRIPWYYPEDFAFFKNITEGHACVMGRNTYNEIRMIADRCNRKALLPNRQCYVLSTTLSETRGATVIQSLHDITCDSYFVIGGKQLYDSALDVANKVYLTTVNKVFECDTYFALDKMHDMFTLANTFPSTHPDLTFQLYERSKDK